MNIAEIIILIFMIYTCVATIYVAAHQTSTNHKWLMLTLICNFFANLLYYIQIKSTVLSVSNTIYLAGLMTKLVGCLCYSQFIIAYCRIKNNQKILLYQMIVAVIIAVCIGTNNVNNWTYTLYDIGFDSYLPYLIKKAHWLYYVYAVYLSTFMYYGLYMLFKKMRSSSKGELTRQYYVLVALVFPLLAFVYQKVFLHDVLDMVVLSWTVSNVLIMFPIIKYGFNDISEQAKALAIDKSTEGLIVVDTEYNVVYANDSIMQKIPYIYNLDKNQKHILMEYFQEKESVFEFDNLNLEARKTNIYEGKHLLGYMLWVFDLTFISSYAQETLKLKEEAESANKAKSAFLANMSHEIRTPMNSIVGFTDLIIENEDTTEVIKDYALDIKRSAKSLLGIINEVLDISKIEAGKMNMVMEKLFIQSLVFDLNRLFSKSASDKGLAFKIDVDDDLPYIMMANVGPLNEVLTNIISNSVKYTKKGTIELIIKEKSRSNNRITVTYTVKDTGIGMSKEDVDAIFEKFSRFNATENKFVEGTGLGMSIVKAYVDEMDGRIIIDSKEGVGTAMTVILTHDIVDDTPISQITAEVRDFESEKTNKKFVSTANILVVDDNEINLKVSAGLLKNFKVHIGLASSGRDAIRKAGLNHFDMIFMDQMMPGMDGIEAMNEIRKINNGEYEKVPIIALTANALTGTKEELLAQGFDGYLSKPVDLNALSLTMQKMLDPKLVIYLVEDPAEDMLKDDFMFDESPSANANDDGPKANIKTESKLIDVEKGIETCGGVDSYAEVLEIVKKNGPARIKKLSDFVENLDFEGYTIDVHALKATAASIGATELSSLAYSHELLGKAKNYDYIKEHYGEVLSLYQEVIDEIDNTLLSINS